MPAFRKARPAKSFLPGISRPGLRIACPARSEFCGRRNLRPIPHNAMHLHPAFVVDSIFVWQTRAGTGITAATPAQNKTCSVPVPWYLSAVGAGKLLAVTLQWAIVLTVIQVRLMPTAASAKAWPAAPRTAWRRRASTPTWSGQPVLAAAGDLAMAPAGGPPASPASPPAADPSATGGTASGNNSLLDLPLDQLANTPVREDISVDNLSHRRTRFQTRPATCMCLPARLLSTRLSKSGRSASGGSRFLRFPQRSSFRRRRSRFERQRQ